MKLKLRNIFKSKDKKRREKLLQEYEEGKVIKIEGNDKGEKK